MKMKENLKEYKQINNSTRTGTPQVYFPRFSLYNVASYLRQMLSLSIGDRSHIASHYVDDN